MSSQEATMNDHSLLSKALEFVSRDAKLKALDAMYCDLHNKAGVLSGNTAEHDVKWLAARIHAEHSAGALGDYDHLTNEAQAQYLVLATVAIASLPWLMDRIANRCYTQAEALRSVYKALAHEEP
jgi:hypothetical protein